MNSTDSLTTKSHLTRLFSVANIVERRFNTEPETPRPKQQDASQATGSQMKSSGELKSPRPDNSHANRTTHVKRQDNKQIFTLFQSDASPRWTPRPKPKGHPTDLQLAPNSLLPSRESTRLSPELLNQCQDLGLDCAKRSANANANANVSNGQITYLKTTHSSPPTIGSKPSKLGPNSAMILEALLSLLLLSQTLRSVSAMSAPYVQPSGFGGFLDGGQAIKCEPGQQVRISDYIPADLSPESLDKCFGCACPDGFIKCGRISETPDCQPNATSEVSQLKKTPKSPKFKPKTPRVSSISDHKQHQNGTQKSHRKNPKAHGNSSGPLSVQNRSLKTASQLTTSSYWSRQTKSAVTPSHEVKVGSTTYHRGGSQLSESEHHAKAAEALGLTTEQWETKRSQVRQQATRTTSTTTTTTTTTTTETPTSNEAEMHQEMEQDHQEIDLTTDASTTSESEDSTTIDSLETSTDISKVNDPFNTEADVNLLDERTTQQPNQHLDNEGNWQTITTTIDSRHLENVLFGSELYVETHNPINDDAGLMGSILNEGMFIISLVVYLTLALVIIICILLCRQGDPTLDGCGRQLDIESNGSESPVITKAQVRDL